MEAMTIVVADDNPRVVDLYVDVLAELGHIVHAFRDGETALGAVASLSPAGPPSPFPAARPRRCSPTSPCPPGVASHATR